MCIRDRVVSFQTVMTGELFALLSDQSVLRHSVKADAPDADAFDAALSETLSRPEKLAHALFGIRAGDLLTDQDAAQARGRLSGLLIGAELAATRPYWLGRDILICGAPALSALYARALTSQGAMAKTVDGDALTLNGLRRAYRILKEGQA